MLAALRRFLAAPTRWATALASVLSTAGWIAGGHLWQPLLLWIVPPGQELVMSSSAEPWLHLALAQGVPAMIPLFAWTVAATRGYKRNTRSGVVTLLACMAPILFGAAAALIGRAMLLRYFWQSSLQSAGPVTIPGIHVPATIRAMVSIDSLNHWVWAGSVASIISIAQIVIHLQYRETPSKSDRNIVSHL